MTDVSVKVSPDVGIVMRAKGEALKRATPASVLKAANYAGGEIARTVYEKLGGGSGSLARSFLPASFVAVPGEIAAEAASDLVYAGIQDAGGTIHPKHGANLAIPVSTQARKKWPRDWPKDKLQLIIAHGKKLLVEQYGKDGRFRLHYVLKPQVTVRATNYLATAADRAIGKVGEIMSADAQAAIDGGV